MSSKRKLILVFDAHHVNRDLTANFLKTAGHEVVEAESAAEASRFVNEKHPHLLLVTLIPDSQEGFEFLKTFKKTHSTPVIAVSPAQDRESIFKAITLGACDYLVQPINSTVLTQKVRKALRSAEFLKVEFDDGAEPMVSVTVPGRIIAANPTGFHLESALRVDRDSSVQVESQMLTDLHFEHHPIKTSPRLGRSFDRGQFVNDIKIMGLTVQDIQTIKKLAEGW